MQTAFVVENFPAVRVRGGDIPLAEIASVFDCVVGGTARRINKRRPRKIAVRDHAAFVVLIVDRFLADAFRVILMIRDDAQADYVEQWSCIVVVDRAVIDDERIAVGGPGRSQVDQLSGDGNSADLKPNYKGDVSSWWRKGISKPSGETDSCV